MQTQNPAQEEKGHDTEDNWDKLLESYNLILSGEIQPVSVPVQKYSHNWRFGLVEIETVDIIKEPMVLMSKQPKELEFTPELIGIGTIDDRTKDVDAAGPFALLGILIKHARSYEDLTKIIELIEDTKLSNYLSGLSVEGSTYDKPSVDGESTEPSFIDQSIAQKLAAFRTSVVRKAITLARNLPNETEIKDITDWLQSHDQNKPIVSGTEMVLRKRCEMIQKPLVMDRLIYCILLRQLRELGYQRQISLNIPFFSAPSLLAASPVLAELLQARLVTEQADAKSEKQEQAYRLIARELIHSLLLIYKEDEHRHKDNVEKILKFIFPNVKRPDSMSRNRLIALANHVCSEIGNVKEKYNPDESGVIGAAFGDLLLITQSSDPSIGEKQTLDDLLYANVISVLLEQRAVTTNQ